MTPINLAAPTRGQLTFQMDPTSSKLRADILTMKKKSMSPIIQFFLGGLVTGFFLATILDYWYPSGLFGGFLGAIVGLSIGIPYAIVRAIMSKSSIKQKD